MFLVIVSEVYGYMDKYNIEISRCDSEEEVQELFKGWLDDEDPQLELTHEAWLMPNADFKIGMMGSKPTIASTAGGRRLTLPTRD